jgi:tRNA threonylcarbamoyladenosine biosynthesis protein TsaB
MRILAVDTALGACSAAIIEDEKTLAHHFVVMERGHAEALAPMVEDVMREAALDFPALDRLAVTTGPGTFTGQRVGLAFMRGLRVALKKPLAGITTLDAMAAAAMDESELSRAAVLHDAKRGEVYVLAGSDAGSLVPLQLAKFEDAIVAIRDATQDVPIAFAGTAAEAAAGAFRKIGGIPRLTGIRQPDALWVARLALNLSEPTDIPKPLYLRAPDAKLPPGSIAGRQLRSVTSSDLEALAPIHAAAFEEGWSARSLGELTNSAGSIAVVAANGAKLFGFVLARVAADEAEILTIAVAPQYRRAGIGKELLLAAMDAAAQKGARAMFLEVSRENIAARTLYAGRGFTEVGARPGYYREKGQAAQDALALKAKLPLQSLGNAAEVD